MKSSMSSFGLELSGLDGANPLGFLAALGTLVTLYKAGESGARLGWRRTVKWTPYLEGLSTGEPEAVSCKLADALQGVPVTDAAEKQRETAQKEFDTAKKELKDKREEIKKRRLRSSARQNALDTEIKPLEKTLHKRRAVWLATLKKAVPRPELSIGKHLDCTGREFRDFANGFLEESGLRHREPLDLMASFGSDSCVDEKNERIRATWFCFITGSGHQYFLDTIRQLVTQVNSERMREALFEPWIYRDEKLSMRWDPLEDRRYALMDQDPTATGNKSRTVWMANLLAYQSLVLFSSAPTKKGLATTGWAELEEPSKADRRSPTFTWPVWEPSLGLDIVRSLLQLRELIKKNPDCKTLRGCGISAFFRSRRIQVGNPPLHKINFSPARSL